MHTYPLEPLTLEQALKLQFRLVDCITRNFGGAEFLSCGDLGLVAGYSKPSATRKVERVIAGFFECEDCVLVRGAGTAAIRWALWSTLQPTAKILLHDAPVYPTTATVIDSMLLEKTFADYNQPGFAENRQFDGALVQYSRQKPADRYSMTAVLGELSAYNVPVVTDDNYVVMKTAKIGAQLGADLSAFSLFKLLGPEGIGCVVGKEGYIDKIARANYSGGGQVQGHEALDALRSMVYAPVALAIQAAVGTEVVNRLNAGELAGISKAFIANAQSRVIIVELMQPCARELLKAAEKLGAAPHPVGAESRYEIAPMFYRVSGTFRASIEGADDRLIRINPMRAGADTVIRLLKDALGKAQAGNLPA